MITTLIIRIRACDCEGYRTRITPRLGLSELPHVFSVDRQAYERLDSLSSVLIPRT